MAEMPMPNSAVIRKNIRAVMSLRNIDYDKLTELFNEAGYPITKSNLKIYIEQRNISMNVLFYLSKTLNVSTDYLLGIKHNSATLMPGFETELYSNKFKKYVGKYKMYFFATRTNTDEKMEFADLVIDESYTVKLSLEVSKENKTFEGKLILSAVTSSAFITLYGDNGEVVTLVFNDPSIYIDNFEFAIAGMLSISSGDLKKLPTFCRAVISRKPIAEDGLMFIRSNLLMNSKYVNISADNLKKCLNEFFQSEKLSDADETYNRLTSAFVPEYYVQLEESYLLNTLSKQLKLSDYQAEKLIAILRLHSASDYNEKVNHNLDSRIYLALEQNNLFE